MVFQYLCAVVKRVIVCELDKSAPVTMPAHMHVKIRAYRQAQSRLTIALMRKPYPWELARALGTSTAAIERLEAVIYAAEVLPLDAPVGEDGDTTGVDMLADDTALDFIRDSERAELRRVLWPLVDVILTEQERAVVVGRFIEGRTLKDLSAQFCVTPERMRWITNDALRKLRRNGKVKRLADDYGYGFRHVGLTEFGTTWTSAVEAEILRREEQREKWVAELRDELPPHGRGRNDDCVQTVSGAYF